jgi:hypothetical protein
VIYKDYDGDTDLQERAGTYAELLLTRQGQAMLEHVGF